MCRVTSEQHSACPHDGCMCTRNQRDLAARIESLCTVAEHAVIRHGCETFFCGRGSRSVSGLYLRVRACVQVENVLWVQHV
jgi:hypothetical protein